jgi:hypothetical protein
MATNSQSYRVPATDGRSKIDGPSYRAACADPGGLMYVFSGREARESAISRTQAYSAGRPRASSLPYWLLLGCAGPPELKRQ